MLIKTPTTQTAVVVAGDDGTVKVVDDIELPALEPDAVLLKIAAIALNPVDTKMMRGFLAPGCVLGLEFAGVVVRVGPNQAPPLPGRRQLEVGDRVFGCTDGLDKSRPLVGAFCQYTACRGDTLIRMPDGMSFADAAAMGNAIFSSGLALFHSLRLPPESLIEPAAATETGSSKSHWVLVYGGATATGTMALQLLRRAGHRPIAVCSPHHFALAASYGAVATFDYRSPSHAADVRALTDGALGHVVDCVTSETSVAASAAALGRLGGRYVALDPFDGSLLRRSAVRGEWVLSIALMGRGCSWPPPFARAPDPALLELGISLAGQAEQVLAEEGSLRPHPIKVMEGGLKAVPEGIREIREGKVRGFKLVYLV